MRRQWTIAACVACTLALGAGVAAARVVPGMEVGTTLLPPFVYENLGGHFYLHEAQAPPHQLVVGVTAEVQADRAVSIRFGVRSLRHTGRVTYHGASPYYHWSGEDRIEERGLVFSSLLTVRPGSWRNLFLMAGPEVVDRWRAHLVSDEVLGDTLGRLTALHRDENVLTLLASPLFALAAGVGAEIPMGAMRGVVQLRYSRVVGANVRGYAWLDGDPLMGYRWREQELLLTFGIAGR